MARCPECSAVLTLSSPPELYDRIYCESCGVSLEVISTSPLEFEYLADYADLEDPEMEWDEDLEDIEEELEEDWEDLFDDEG